MDDGGPAFPATPELLTVREDGSAEPLSFPGMSLRDWFAGQALAGVAQAAHAGGGYGFLEHKDLVAQYAYAMADAMLEARK